MAGKTTPVLLVTANVGSIFEDPSHMLKIWTEEFLSTVSKLDPKFIALHCQEVGGKNYERSMKHVEDFVRLFMSSEELRLFDKVRVFLDEDYSSAEHFTALGNFYFIHESLAEVLIWDFAAMTFVSAKGKEVHSGNIEGVTTKEKSKFPQDFFPECKWSRKGFLRTRWSLNGTVFDLINIHLFHDASNFIAMESFPSVYCKNRRRALEHTLERFHSDSYGIAPFFVFGDFNFRTDTQGVINKLSDGLNAVRVQSNKSSDHTKLQYKDDASQVVLSLGKKEFSHADHQTVFFDESGMWLKEFDRELEAFGGRLFEFPITFPPSYPFEEDEKGGNNYMKTRCPAWCDRVILSNTAKNLVNNISQSGCVEYGLMGPNTRMGDHKPVFLKLDLINDAGTVKCCTPCESSSSDKRVLCFGNVAVFETSSWSCSSLSLKKSGSAPSALTLKLDTTAAALAADRFLAPPHASLLHEPYTPESMETPTSSPVPLRIQRDFGEVDWKSNLDDDDDDEDMLEFKKMYSNDKRTTDNYSNFMATKIVNELENREPNSKNSSNNAFNTTPRVQHCIPHVLICYSDPQDRIFSSSRVELKSDLKSRHSEPNLSVRSVSSHFEPNETRLFKLHQIKEDYKTSSSHSSILDSDTIGDENSATNNEINHKEVCEDFIPSPANATSSPDSGILPSMSSHSLDYSSRSVSQTNAKKESLQLCDVQFAEDISLSTLSDGKELGLELSSEFTQNNMTNDDVITNIKHNVHLERSLHESKSNDVEQRVSYKGNVEDCKIKLQNVDSDNNIDLCIVPEPLSCKAPQNSVSVVPPSKEVIINISSNDVEKKPHIPIIPQDSISIVLSEISSQDKTKNLKYKNKRDPKRKSNATNCCSLS